MPVRCLTLTIIISLFAGMAKSQEVITTQTAPAKIVKAYREAEEQYTLGYFTGTLAILESLVDRNPGFIDAQILLGQTYYRLGDTEKTAEQFEKVIALDPAYDPRIHSALASVYAGMNEYAMAIKTLDRYKASTTPGNAELYDIELDKKLYAFRDSMVMHAVAFDPVPVKGEINSPDDEALPVFTVDGERMIFTRYVQGQEDLFTAKWDSANSAWVDAKEMGGVNSSANEGAPSLAADGSVIAFTACGRPGGLGHCDIYIARRQPDGTWEPARNAIELNSPGWDGQPSLTPDGNGIYFASDRPGGAGRRDLWYSEFNSGSWAAPVNCGTVLNTSGHESAPFLAFDRRTLFFMSDGHMGMGDYDIFRSRFENGTWSEPVNIGFPVNTPDREGGLSIHPDGIRAFYTKEATPGGRMDLYTFELDPLSRPDRISFIAGTVTDRNSGVPLAARVRLYNLADSSEQFQFYTDKTGEFLASLVHGEEYGVHAVATGYVFYSDHYALPDTTDYSGLKLHIRLVPVEQMTATDTTEPVVLENIQFAFGDSLLLPSSEPELNLVLNLMVSNDQLRIKVLGHTDDIGTENDNLGLSRARARAVVNWLVARGIEPSRLTYEGFGEGRPLVSNETPEGRRKNRRTELVIQ